MQFIAIFLFGIVVGFLTYRTIARQTTASVNDISAVIGAIGGAAVMTFLGIDRKTGATDNLWPYCIGLFVGFFGYFTAAMLSKKPLPYH